jgi:hypothetical protein
LQKQPVECNGRTPLENEGFQEQVDSRMVTPAAHFCTGAIPLGKTLAATAATRRPWFVTLSDKRRSFRSAVCHLEANRQTVAPRHWS